MCIESLQPLADAASDGAFHPRQCVKDKTEVQMFSQGKDVGFQKRPSALGKDEFREAKIIRR